ncbi:MAG: helix-turn-helix transcriptional regulator [Thermoplasmata archaeon]|nr:helix-turn-helix transcriptional regulator [Thermoplasmata archaeon]
MTIPSSPVRSSGTVTGPYPEPPAVAWEVCPIETTLGSLGRKWTIPILREVAFIPKASFGLIRRRNPGLRQRTLSIRLRQLTAEGLIRRVVLPEDVRHPYYELTEKGLEVWPILTSLFQFGIRHHAGTVFADGRPRDIQEVYPRDAALMLGPLAAFARTVRGAPNSPRAARSRAAPTGRRGSSR